MNALLRQALNAWNLLRIREFAALAGECPICGPTVFVKLAANALSVRCVRCRASAIHVSICGAVKDTCLHLSDAVACEFSSRGPLYNFLKRRVREFHYSEYFDDVVPGGYKNGVQCQDVQLLTYASAQFDLCTSTEVFEHVPDDMQGFREVLRVLRTGGKFIFTVPLSGESTTVERAVLVDGAIRHRLPPEYHGDAIRGQAQVLCFRNYGSDILDRLLDCGFRDASFYSPDKWLSWGMRLQVVTARK